MEALLAAQLSPKELLDELAAVADELPAIADGFTRSNTSPEATQRLGATDPGIINLVVCGIIVFIVLAVSIGCYAGQRSWIPAMVIASYLVLLPGLFTKDFSFNIAAVVPNYVPVVGGTRYQITQPQGIKGPIRESTRSLVPLLWRTGSHNGAILIFVFAFMVPVAKLALLAVGEYWRHSPEPSKVRHARRCIQAVQVVSKWASPDMYAFMLLYYLLRSVNQPPFLESIQVLDIGFACYNVFCVTSVISTMSVALPGLPAAAPQSPALSSRSSVPDAAPTNLLAPTYLLFIVVPIAAIWSVFFVHGVFSPCMSLHLNTGVLVKALGLPSSLDTLVGSLGLEDLIGSEVTLWKATSTFWSWFKVSGELNLLLAWAMLGVFGLALTVADVLCLMAIAFMVSWPPGGRWNCTGTLIKWTHVMKHLALLDVCTAGVIVVSFAAEIYREQGLIIRLESGVFFVAASEVVHCVLFYVVHHVAHHASSETAEK